MEKKLNRTGMIRWGQLFNQMPKLIPSADDPDDDVTRLQFKLDHDLIPAAVAKQVDPSGKNLTRFGQNLLAFIDHSIEIATPFGPLAGTLITVQEDYLALMDSSSAVVLVPFQHIEFISTL